MRSLEFLLLSLDSSFTEFYLDTCIIMATFSSNLRRYGYPRYLHPVVLAKRRHGQIKTSGIYKYMMFLSGRKSQ